MSKRAERLAREILGEDQGLSRIPVPIGYWFVIFYPDKGTYVSRSGSPKDVKKASKFSEYPYHYLRISRIGANPVVRLYNRKTKEVEPGIVDPKKVWPDTWEGFKDLSPEEKKRLMVD